MKTTISLLFILIFSFCAFGQQTTAKVITATELRDQPNAQAKVVRLLKRGLKLSFSQAQTKDGFCYVTVEGVTGWVSEKALKPVKAKGKKNQPPSVIDLKLGLPPRSGS